MENLVDIFDDMNKSEKIVRGPRNIFLKFRKCRKYLLDVPVRGPRKFH